MKLELLIFGKKEKMPEFIEKYIKGPTPRPFTDYEAKFSKEEAEAYEENLKSYRDLKNSLDTAFEEGMEKGIQQVALGLIQANISDEVILATTGLTQEQLEHLKRTTL